MVTKQIFISRDVSFHETIFLFISPAYSPHTSISLPHICPNAAIPHDPIFSEPFTPSLHVPSSDSGPQNVSDSSLDSSLPIISNSTIPKSIIPTSDSSDLVSPGSIAPDSLPLPQGQNIVQPAIIPSLRRLSRLTKPPSYLQDYKCSSIMSTKLS